MICDISDPLVIIDRQADRWNRKEEKQRYGDDY
jgi:hypothetical protein